MERPLTRYAKTKDGVHLAYQVLGDGPVDQLFLPHRPVAIDALWEHPGHLRWTRHASTYSRLIMFDPRGVGASDPASFSCFSDRDSWLEDAETIMDAVGAEEAVVVGEGLGGLAAINLAVRRPQRTVGLVLVNSYACLARSDDHPYGLRPDQRQRAVELVEGHWGSGQVVANGVPHLGGGGHEFSDFCSRFERMAAAPATAAAIVHAMLTCDARDQLPLVTTPCLVVYTNDLPLIRREHALYLTEHIPNARLVESTTESFYALEPQVAREVWGFVGGVTAADEGDRELLALVFTDIVSSTERAAERGDIEWKRTLDDLDQYVVAEFSRLSGRLVKQTGDGHLGAFARPTEAIRAALRVRDGAGVHAVEVRIGVHFGEVEVRANGDVTGSNANIAARILGMARPGEILVSNTVRDLVAGSGIEFTDRGEHDLKGVPGSWRLFAVER